MACSSFRLVLAHSSSLRRLCLLVACGSWCCSSCVHVLHGVGGRVAWLVLAVHSRWCSSVLVGCCCCSSMFIGVDAAVVFCLLFMVFMVGLLGWCWLRVRGVRRCCWGAAVVRPCSWHWRCCCPASTHHLRGTGGVAWLVPVVGSRWRSTAGCCCCSSMFVGVDVVVITVVHGWRWHCGS